MRKKIVYIISNINKALAFEWIASALDKKTIDLQFILLNPGNSELEAFLSASGIPVQRFVYRGKKDLPIAFLKTYLHLQKIKPDAVHAHLFDASLIGITAAWCARVPQRIYTRHHADFHHAYHPHAVKYDRLINRFSTAIVAVSLVVKDILIQKENTPASKIHLIHHGFDLSKFSTVPAREVEKLKEKYNPQNASPVIGVISRYIEVKGIQYIIPAYAKFIKKYPNAMLILANAQGSYSAEIKNLLKQIPQKNYVEILFEPQVFSLYRLFDLFVHASVYKELESFGQVYVEALISKIPSIFTLSGIANEFISDHHNALVVPYRDPEAIYKAMLALYENEKLKKTLAENGEKDVISKFNLSKMILALEKLYAN